MGFTIVIAVVGTLWLIGNIKGNAVFGPLLTSNCTPAKTKKTPVKKAKTANIPPVASCTVVSGEPQDCTGPVLGVSGGGHCTAPDLTIPWTPGVGVTVGQGDSSLYSPSRTYRALMQADGNFVGYRQSTNTAIWSTGTYHVGVAGNNYQGYAAKLSNAGSLVIRDSAGNLIWQSAGAGAATLEMQDDGNLVLYSAKPAHSAIWSMLYPVGNYKAGQKK